MRLGKEISVILNFIHTSLFFVIGSGTSIRQFTIPSMKLKNVSGLVDDVRNFYKENPIEHPSLWLMSENRLAF